MSSSPSPSPSVPGPCARPLRWCMGPRARRWPSPGATAPRDVLRRPTAPDAPQKPLRGPSVAADIMGGLSCGQRPCRVDARNKKSKETRGNPSVIQAFHPGLENGALCRVSQWPITLGFEASEIHCVRLYLVCTALKLSPHFVSELLRVHVSNGGCILSC